MSVLVVLFALFIPWAVSAYFSYIGGVTGKAETRLLHPLGLGMMVIALAAALVASVQVDTWTFQTHPGFQLLMILLFVAIASTPMGCYSVGKQENEERAKQRREAAEERLAR